MLLTYFNVSTEAGAFGWGTGRLRVLGEQGAAVYAGRNPNKLAYFALFGLTLLWYGRRAIKSPFIYPLWFVATLIAFIMIPMTGSRSGILNLLFFVIILLIVIMLFGSRRLGSLGADLGNAVRGFRKSVADDAAGDGDRELLPRRR